MRGGGCLRRELGMGMGEGFCEVKVVSSILWWCFGRYRDL